MRTAIETGEPQEAEESGPGGRVFAVRAYPVRDDSGAIAGTVEVGLDVTESRRAAEQLRESEREKALILGSISELVCFQNRDPSARLMV